MNEDVSYISAAEAAEMVGVTKETIRNLCKAGTLRYERRNQFFYPCRQDVELHFQSIKEIHEIERSIEDYKKEIEKIYAQIRETKTDLQARLEEMKLYPERIYYILQTGLATLQLYGRSLTDREWRMVEAVLKGEALQDVAHKEQISYNTARQIVEKTLRKLAFAVNRTKEQESLISEHEQTIQGLQGKLYTEGRTIYTPEQQEILKKRISDFDFPVRIWICLRAAEILTVGDLVKHHRSDLLEFRNFGKKSIVELDKFLEAHGLSWGMEIE